MKKLFLIITMVGAVSLSACSDWFDINPKTDVKASQLFESEDGFMEALAGIYVLMTNDGAYGSNMSFGMLDQLAQLYSVVPDGATNLSQIYNYATTTSGGFNTKGKQASVWSSAYNIIANANNLLKWLDANGERVIASEQTRNMIRGEALALRAYLHFDLLRMWGPIYSEKPTEKSIPYRTIADKEKLPCLTAQEVVKHVVDDLLQAKTLLSYEAETSLGNSWDASRRFRMNYHAVNALLARVYCYTGDSTNAVNAAKEVINSCGLTLQVSNTEDPVLFSETLFGVNIYKMSENFTSKFSTGPKFTTQFYTSTDVINQLFESSGTSADVDMRAKSAAILRYDAQKQAISRKYIRNDNAMVPLIRLPEMYYILCEMSPLDEAPQYINQVRSKRGYSSTSNYSSFSSDAVRTQMLDKEYRKEFYAEGQYFYFLKRHKTASFINLPDGVTMGEEQYVFPLPDNEKEYGWTDEEENAGGADGTTGKE